MNKKVDRKIDWKGILLCLFIIWSLLATVFIISTKVGPSNYYKEFQSQIEAVDDKLDSLKLENTTIIQKNDSIQVRIVEVRKEYEETINTIIGNDVSADYEFFTDYLSGYFDIDFSDTTEVY